MRRRGKFAIALAGFYALSLGVTAVGAVAVWLDLEPAEREAALAIVTARLGLLAFAALFLLAVLWVVVEALLAHYVVAPLEVAEATRIISRANPSHRIEPKGSVELRELAEAINAFAERHQAFLQDVENRIADAQRKVQEERNRLAALLSQLAQSVLVCNLEGRILLYNDDARRLLAGAPAGAGSLVGLGRSVFAILERDLITHALDVIQARADKGDANPVATFVASVGAGKLVRVRVAPVRGADAQEPAVSGFVLVMDDVTRAVEAGSAGESALDSLVEASRRGLASVRAAAETLLQFRDMPPERQSRFLQVISEEAASLSGKLESAGVPAPGAGADWLLDDMLAADLVAAARARLEGALGMRVGLGAVEASLWLKVDSYSVLLALTALARRLRDEMGVREVSFRLQAGGRFAQLDLEWSGAPAAAERLASWEAQPLAAGGATTVKDVVARHGGELWAQVDRERRTAFFRLLLPAARAGPPSFRAPATAAPARPEFYDFDLFHQAGQTAEVDARRLTDLAYTVFDTETTGLAPSDGDEIVCIGALRIVNGRLLHHEAFEQFIDPRRPMSLETVRITGIDPEMLAGQPTIEQVLPRFHEFCADSVLVGHNAAFDMRFLQLKEEQAGVRFTQPVVDTLLLASIVQPNLGAPALEALAERFGVPAIGRHTALGDAIMTGEIFLRLVPLLAERGIHTLGEAREASQRTWLARVRY